MVYSSTVLLKLNWEIAMTASIQHIETQVLSLPREARTRLAIHLLESIEERPNMDPQQVELAWLAEANRRFQAYQAGEEQAIPADQVFADLRADDR
jgi:putative addiction module component (TIGR02574 family)